MKSLNLTQLIGHLGKDPEIRRTQEGKAIASFSLATSDSWKDKTTGETREETHWHRIVIPNDGLASVAERFLRKGSKVYVQGRLENRKWTDDQGQERTVTEIVLRPTGGQLIMLDGQRDHDARPGQLSEADTGAMLDDQISY